MNTYPYVEARHQGGRHRPTSILIKPSWTTSDEGAALGVAQRQHMHDAPHETFHFTVDEEQIFQCVPARTVAGHEHCAQKGLLKIKVCFDPSVTQYGWNSGTYVRLLDQLSTLTAQLTVDYKIRPRMLNYLTFDRWTSWHTRRRGGIFAQMEGPWPQEDFIAQVERKRKEY